MNNPLLLDIFNTPYEAIPFDKIQLQDYFPAFQNAIEKAQHEINDIVTSSELPTFENTIVALEKSGKQLEIISSVFFNMNSACTNDEMQDIAMKISPELSEHSNNILLNERLFERIKYVYDNKIAIDLDSEDQMLLEKTYKNFYRNGALLNTEDKTLLREISKELSTLSLQFGQNVLAESNAFELHIIDESDLNGLPESALEAAKMVAKEKGKAEGWVFTLDYPSYIPFMTYADNRTLREQLYKAFSSKSNHNNERDNKDIVLKITLLRNQKAQLLGYTDHASYVLEERMATSPSTVFDFLSQMKSVCIDKAKEEANELQEFAKTIDGPDKLQKWDVAYYTEKLKLKTLNFDEEKLKPYFQLEKVIDGVFLVANKLFGLVFEEVQDIPKYHEDVKTYKVTREGEFIALFYGDFFPRSSKRQGAWMTSFKGQSLDQKGNHRPHISNVCNFTKPTETKPSLLTFEEVTTLFHEFGHGLHGMLANTKYESLSGTNVMWDFVELPSQILENWCYEKECLDLFAKHYETGESIPQEYIDQIRAGLTFRSGSQSLRQLTFGLLDMYWHTKDVSTIKDVIEFEKSVLNELEIYPIVDGTCTSTQFSHIFQGGYSAGYYSYKWAEVLDADAFESFKENGIFDKTTAKSFSDYILSKGGTVAPDVLYQSFKGRKPDANALLKRSGLLK